MAGLGEEPYERQVRRLEGMSGTSPHLLGATGGPRPTPPSRGHGVSLVFLNEMEMSGAWPVPCSPRPCPPRSGLQVLEDDGSVVAQHVGDTAGAGLGGDRGS